MKNSLKSSDYLLSDKEDTELKRLAYQHHVWKAETSDVLSRAKFSKNQTILDLGCGPGFLSFDLAEIVEDSGKIIALDNSGKFIESLKEKIKNSKRLNIEALLGDILQMKFNPNTLDGAISRWVMMFLPEPEKVVRKVYQSLLPNGVFAVMEYFQFRSMSIYPYKKSFINIFHAVFDLIQKFGGNADIGGLMPQMMSRAGFRILDIFPIFRVGRTGTEMWNWLEQTNKNHTNLLDKNLVGESELKEYYHDWEVVSNDPNAFFTAPPVLVTIGVKPPQI